MQLEIHFPAFWVYIFEKFPPFGCKASKILRKFWSAKGKGLKVPDAHPYPRLYRSAPPGKDGECFTFKLWDCAFTDTLWDEHTLRGRGV